MRPITRRGFLAGVGASIAATQLRAGASGLRLAPAAIPGPPFALGVASGDPVPQGFVIWTRLAPDPLNGGGMPPDDQPVAWEVATDSGFADVVANGTAVATAALAHSVHVEVDGLDADSWYWYRFSADGFDSPVGKARTTPMSGRLDALRFGVGSCQSWTSGYYTAHRFLAQEGCDVTFWLGDYIYEGGGNGVRPHNSGEVTTLPLYRNRYGLYKGDPDLQASHAANPWLVVWDDHEVDNNYAGDISSTGTPTAEFLARRAAAYQAWYEHQPVRLAPPGGDSLKIYRRFEWGALANFHLLDGRQYRSDQACGDGLQQPCDEWDDESRTMLGTAQEQWLLDGVGASTAVWDVLAQQTVFSPMPIGPLKAMDQWDGYPAQRDRVWNGGFADATNPLVITGDIHAAGAARLHQDLEDETTPVIGHELVGTSISSGFTSGAVVAAEQLIGGLPWVDYVNATDRGFMVVDMTAEGLTATYRTVSAPTTQQGTVSTDFVYEIEARPFATPPTTSTTTTSPTSTTTPTGPAAPPAAPVAGSPTFTG